MRKLKPGDKVFILPGQHTWEWPSPKSIQTIKLVHTYSSNNRSYVMVKETNHAYILERCVLAGSIVALERIIYGFEP